MQQTNFQLWLGAVYRKQSSKLIVGFHSLLESNHQQIYKSVNTLLTLHLDLFIVGTKVEWKHHNAQIVHQIERKVLLQQLVGTCFLFLAM